MDEIEYRRIYNEACTAVERITAPETKTALALVTLLIWSLNERLSEIVEGMDDE